MAKLKQASGNWVSGAQFWDREADVGLFVERLDEGAHILLVAQRRMGKTSLMHEVGARLHDRYICLFVDLQKARTPEDAIVELSLAVKPHASLWSKTKDLFGNILKSAVEAIDKLDVGELGVTLRAGLTSSSWAQKGDQLLTILAESEKPVVLMMDEVPILVNRILKGEDYTITPQRKAEAEAFMSWLRENSIRHKGILRLVVSGSVGFEPILHQAGLSGTINTLQPFELKPWDEAAAVGCIEALANEYGVTLKNDAAAEMARWLGCCIPHHVQMFFSHVYERCVRRKRMEFFADEVADIYKDEMLSIRGHAELTHYEERLKLVLGQDAFPLALEMLTEAAVTGRLDQKALSALRESYAPGTGNVADAQVEILRVLEHDGYLQSGDDGYRFVSHLLRDWWRKRYGGFHTPVLERGV
jgi:hypothetical protein